MPIQKNTATLEDSRACLAFAYDPALIEQVKTIHGRRWQPDRKRWSLPLSEANAHEIAGFLKAAGFHVEASLQARLDSLLNVDADAEAFEVRPGLRGTLRPFQVEGVRYLVQRKRALLGDQMGTGKTVQALGALHHAQAFPSAVICPASLVGNWKNEIRKWLPEDEATQVEVLSYNALAAGRKRVKGAPSKKGDLVEFSHPRDGANLRGTVLSYRGAEGSLLILSEGGEQVTVELSAARLRKAVSIYPEAERLAASVRTVIVDESHFIKNGKAQRSEAASAAMRNAEFRFALTGTPIVNRPMELISQLRAIDRLGDLGGRSFFSRHYCNGHQGRWGWDESGATNLEELNLKLRMACYLRREKNEVLPELPAKSRTMIPVSLSNRKTYDRAEADFLGWLQDEKPDNVTGALLNEALVKIGQLKQLSAAGKMEAALEWIENFFESGGEKLVIFAHHRATVALLEEQTGGLVIDGSTPNAERTRHVERFQTDPKVRIIICSITAAGVGLTLTAASDVLFIELGWTPAEMDQAEDRLHRIGQHAPVTAHWLLGADSIDETIAALIESKRAVTEAGSAGPHDIAKALIAKARNKALRGA